MVKHLSDTDCNRLLAIVMGRGRVTVESIVNDYDYWGKRYTVKSLRPKIAHMIAGGRPDGLLCFQVVLGREYLAPSLRVRSAVRDMCQLVVFE
jgi:hypothetical protein